MAGSAQPKPISITTYPGSAVDDNLAKEIVREGSHRLVIDNGGNPVSCGLDLAAVTPLRVLTVEPNAVVIPDDYCKICDVAADIHVVKSIQTCGQFGDASEGNVFYGCSRVGCGMVVDISGLPRSNDLELLAESQWMHEYGHTQGLRDTSGPNLLMNRVLVANQFQVGARDCNQIRGKNSPQPAAATTPKEDVNTFVRQIYTHGVPLDQARTYTPDEVDQVAGLLDSCKAANSDVCRDTPEGQEVEAGLTNVVLLIGVAGDPKTALNSLNAFLQRPPVDSPWFYQARLAVPLAVGYLLRRNSKDEAALRFLQEGTDLNVWRSRGLKLTPAESLETSAVALTQNSILGLGLSRNPQALLFLQQLEKHQKDILDQTQRSKDLIDHAIKVNQNK
jgi:hypothetical protein